METVEIGTSGIIASRVGLGTEAIAAWQWGGDTADLQRLMSTIRSAIERGMTLIDTAPIYGFGLAERIIGKILSEGLRSQAIIATQTGLQWRGCKVRRNSSPAHVRKEAEQSLRRLRTDHIDLYIVQWPDPLTPIHETAKTLARLLKEGKIRAIGVSNYSPAQMDEFRQAAPIHVARASYNLFEREAETSGVVSYAKRLNIAVLCDDILCRGLLTATIRPTAHFKGNDPRHADPKFHEPRLSQYASAAAALDRYTQACYGLPVTALAVRWVLEQGNTIALWSARRPEQLDPLKAVTGWKLDDMVQRQIDHLIRHAVKDPTSPRFIPPPTRSKLSLVA